MLLRIRLVLWYILSCIRILTPPWKYFQLNAVYFNETKGIFSKLEIDQWIPRQWRLQQYPLTHTHTPSSYPVFIKPEWGQNAHGIRRADNIHDYNRLKNILSRAPMPYLTQLAAREPHEYEIFYIRDHKDSDHFAVLTATEVTNTDTDRYAINSVLNEKTVYTDISHQFIEEDLDRLWSHINQLGHYRIARICIRADSIQEMLKGVFHIIEINLFIPLPLRLLDADLPQAEKSAFIRKSMIALAKTTKAIPADQEHKSIFFRKLLTHYRIRRNTNKL